MINIIMKFIISFFIIFYVFFIPLEAKIINNLIIEGNDRVSSQTIKVFSGFNEGSNINDNDLNEIIKELYNTNFFKEVSIEIKNDNLIITVLENPIIQEVLIEGIKKESFKKDIYDSLTLKNKSSYVEFIAKNDLQKIKNTLRLSGFYLSDVKTSTKKNNNNTIDLIYNINLGKKALIKNIKFIGDKKFKNRKLRQVIVSEENKFWKFLSSKKYLNANQIKFDERLLLNFYRDSGFYKANIEASTAKFVDDQNFELTYNINAGEKFIFNDIKLILPPDYEKKNFSEISKTFLKLKDSTYSLNKINKILKEIDKIALIQQYEFISAKVEENIIDLNKLNLTFVIIETEKNYVEKINIIGNSITRENVIRNSLLVDEGDAFNEILHNKSINKIKGRRIFENVKSKILDGSSENLKIVEIEVVEKATGEISAGAGLGSSGGSIGFGIKENNYMGKGVRVNANLNFTQASVRGELSFENPNFRNSNNSLFTILKSIKTDRLSDSGYETSNMGISFGSNFEKYENLFLYPSVEINREVLKTAPIASASLKKQEGNYFETNFNYVLDYDKRDRSYQTTEGFRSKFSQTLPLIADTYELRNSYEFTKYQELYNGMLSTFTFTTSSVNSLNDKDVRISKRLSIPERKLRGFEKGKIGPIENNDYIGGNYSAVINLNTTLPNLFPESENTDFKFFFDAATLWGVDYSSSVSDTGTVRSAVGMGIDWFTPIGPLNFSLSQAITKDSSDKTEGFRFNLGTTF
jgi:outer membrane protein insertion porin family